MTIPTPYEDLLADVLANGTPRADRTGTGTIGVFGRQIRFDLAKGFPLITTKKVFTRGVIEELLWFLAGDTNAHTLRDKGVHIWDAWAREDGELGPVYGKQFRHVSSVITVKPKVFEPAETDSALPTLLSEAGGRDLNQRSVYGVGYYGAYDKTDPHYDKLVNVWRQMIRRCYDDTCPAYHAGYGANGVHVSERWQCFANFQKDVRKIPNWHLKADYWGEYSLDKDTRFASNRYDVETCMWATEAVQNANRSNSAHFQVTDPAGDVVQMPTIGEMGRRHGVNVSAVHRALNGKLKTHHGWREFTYITAPEGMVTRYNEVDQMRELITSIKHDPFSRRHMISLWNPSEISFMELPPCHGNVIQFHVTPDADGKPWKLNCQVYQRSCDLFLGEPFNIASYAILTHMIAQQTGLEVGEFIHTFGDAHIYSNHVDQVKEQLSREARPYPELKFNRKPESIFDYTIADFVITGYDPHPLIKAPVAV